MGVVEAKLVLNNDELPPSPSWNSLDVVLADVARLEVGEKPGNGVDAPGIAVAQANVGVDPDPRSYKKGVEEAEKEVPMQFPQRSEAPDCAFYMKTGACKFGSACKFNHPPKRRKPRVRANKGAENVQAAREEHKSNGSKMMTQGARRDDNVEKQTSSRRLQQEDCKFQKNAIGKQIPPFKKFEQTEKKAAQMERHRLRSEQDDSKFQNNAVGKQIPPFKKFVQIEKKADEVERNCSTSEKEDSKFQNNAVGKQIPPFKKFVQIEKKADVVERNSSTSEKEDSKFQNNAVGKQIPPFKKFVQIEKKADEVERNCSTSDKEDSKFQNNAVGKQIPPFKKFVQIEKKADEVERKCSTSEKEDSKLQKNAIRKQIPPFKKFEQTEKKTDKEEKQCSMLEQEDSKATEKMSKEAISGNVGMAECKFYKTSGRCKYGKSCKYIHSLKKIEVASPALNFLGLPIRPGEKECPCYMHTGNCKYAANCKYHHPEPTVATLEQGALPVFQIGGSEQQIPFGASSLPVTPSPTQGAFYVPTPLTAASPAYFPESHLHPQGLLFPSNSECNGYQMHTKRPGETEYQYHPKISHLNA